MFGKLVIDAAGLAGLSALLFGVHLIHRPAAFIVGGVLLLTYAVVASAKSAKENAKP